ncbi:hypothetical protein Tco_0960678 [Tanacetum coccineum]
MTASESFSALKMLHQRMLIVLLRLYHKMPPRKAPRTRTTPATAIATTPMTNAAIRAMISRGVADALAEHEIQRNNNLNGDGS